MKTLALAICLCATLSIGALGSGSVVFKPVDLQAVANDSIINLYNSNEVLKPGDVMLGGVPFHIPSSNKQAWNSNTGPEGKRTVTIPVGIYGVVSVHTLMNAYWCTKDGYTKIEFIGSDGAFYERELVAGVDIRDWFRGDYTNTINGTTTTMVLNGSAPNMGYGSYHVDKQQFDLPAEFARQKLLKIVITDLGDKDIQRVFIMGITAACKESISPEIANVIKRNDDSMVQLRAKTVTHAGSAFFYIEDDSQECGIRVEKARHGVSAGDRVDVTGLLQTSTSKERVISATIVERVGYGNIPAKALIGIDMESRRKPGVLVTRYQVT